jgi:protein-tyrosine phosphatase
MTHPKKLAVLTLCLGNICRSPIAEGLIKAHAESLGLVLYVDSAGTSGYHTGEAPDPRSIKVMQKHGYNITMQRSRQLTIDDFNQFDLILAMDQSNINNAYRIAKTDSQRAKVVLFLRDGSEVPDPYYGGVNGFEDVYQMISESASDWVKFLIMS